MTDEREQEPGEGPDTSEEIHKAVEERIRAKAQELTERKAGKTSNGNGKIDSTLIDKYIYQGELGDGRLYAEQHRDKLFSTMRPPSGSSGSDIPGAWIL